jgi:hypothetical protein
MPDAETAELLRQIEALEICNKQHLDRIWRLNALLVAHEREADAAEATITRLRANLDAARDKLSELPY